MPKWIFNKNQEVLISSRKRFSQKRTFYGIKTTNRPDQNDRKKRAKISWFHKKVPKTCVFTRETCVFHENHDFSNLFIKNFFHLEIMLWPPDVLI